MIGVEFVEDRESRRPDAKAFQHVAAHAFDRELIIIECGPDGNVLRFIPPLITTMDELDWALDLVDEGLESWEHS
jgi:4-aminobutyrate aminotransferase-like enzyme